MLLNQTDSIECRLRAVKHHPARMVLIRVVFCVCLWRLCCLFLYLCLLCLCRDVYFVVCSFIRTPISAYMGHDRKNKNSKVNKLTLVRMKNIIPSHSVLVVSFILIQIHLFVYDSNIKQQYLERETRYFCSLNLCKNFRNYDGNTNQIDLIAH